MPKISKIRMTKRVPSERFEARRSAIVVAAIEMINHKGVRAMTLGDVAERVGLVATAVSYYFRSKEELARTCFLKGIAQFDQLVAAAEAGRTVRERIAIFLRGYFELKRLIELDQADMFTLFNDVRALNAPEVNAAYTDLFRRVRGLLKGPETQSRSRPELNASTHLLMSEVFWAIAWIERHDSDHYPRLADRVLSTTMEGLAPPGVPWAPAPFSASFVAVPDATDETFLRAATELINEQGYVGASVDKISARLRLTKGAFYHYHRTKDEMVIACFERTFQVMREAFRHAEQSSGSEYQILTTAASALVEYQMSGVTRLLRTSALTSAPEALQPKLLGEFDRITLRFATLISDGIAAESIRPVDPNVAAQMLTGMINASAELHYWTHDLSASSAAQAYVRLFFEGLLLWKRS